MMKQFLIGKTSHLLLDVKVHIHKITDLVSLDTVHSLLLDRLWEITGIHRLFKTKLGDLTVSFDAQIGALGDKGLFKLVCLVCSCSSGFYYVEAVVLHHSLTYIRHKFHVVHPASICIEEAFIALCFVMPFSRLYNLLASGVHSLINLRVRREYRRRSCDTERVLLVDDRIPQLFFQMRRGF